MMNKIIFLLYVNIILIALPACDLKANDKSPNVVKAVIEGSITEPEAFLFSHSGKTCRLLSNGEGSCKSLDNKSVLFNLGINESDRISTVFSFLYSNDIYLIYEAHDHESGYVKIVRLDGQFLQSKWLTHIPGFNVGEGLVRDGFLYISAFGFIGKIDLKTGNYIWKHSELYLPPDYFNSFERPTIVENIVYFPESKPTYLKRQSLTIKVNNI